MCAELKAWTKTFHFQAFTVKHWLKLVVGEVL